MQDICLPAVSAWNGLSDGHGLFPPRIRVGLYECPLSCSVKRAPLHTRISLTADYFPLDHQNSLLDAHKKHSSSWLHMCAHAQQMHDLP